MDKKHIGIIGAGPGGLTAAMILAHRGFRVTVFEKEKVVGGRNASFSEKGFSFDIGPTFLMMKFILDEMFEETGRDSSKYMDFIRLEPMYSLLFEKLEFKPTTDKTEIKKQIAMLFPGNENGYGRLMKREGVRFRKLYPCLQKDYCKFRTYFHKDMINALPHLSLGKTLFQNLGKYFDNDTLKTCFTFQAKYLGMSPWECPAFFTIIPYIEHTFGIYHVIGGLSKISEAMAKVVKEESGEIRLGEPVKKLIIENRIVTGVELESGEKVFCDEVIVNSDFAYTMSHNVEPGILHKYSKEKLYKKDYSCSTFMIYMGLDKIYDEPFHRIIFADDYKKNIDEIAVKKIVSEDMSVYVRNASIIDPKIAPAGKSALYILVPAPNNKSGIDWEKIKKTFRDKVVARIASKTSMKDLNSRIEFEKIITPAAWENERSVYLGATFNLAHTFNQFLHFRPRNKFEELGHCYLVGGGTHPGSGLPTIYESARISSNLISKKYNARFSKPKPLP